MSYQSLTLTMLISAPSDVVAADLQAVADTISRWNFRSGRLMTTPVIVLPIIWSQHSHSVFGTRPQSALNDQLVEAADFGIALFANRLGTPTGSFPSGTAEEIDALHQAGKKVSVLRNTGVPLVSGPEASAERHRLDEYLASLKDRLLWFDYATTTELVGQVENILAAQAGEAAAAKPGAGVDDAELERVLADIREPAPMDPSLGVWPTTVAETTIITSGRGEPRSKRNWYLVLSNETGEPVKNVRFYYDAHNGYNPTDFDLRANHHEAVPHMAPGATVRFPITRAFGLLDQVDCVVKWQYNDAQDETPLAGGTDHETRATVRAI